VQELGETGFWLKSNIEVGEKVLLEEVKERKKWAQTSSLESIFRKVRKWAELGSYGAGEKK